MIIHSGIKDDGSNFQIVPSTRKIVVPQSHKIIGTVGSHNSEQLTFQCPKIIDGHDVSGCSDHFISWVNASGKDGRYTIKKEHITIDRDVIYLTWVIESGVTVSEGSVRFAMHFEDIDEDGTLIYSWGTTECNECQILSTVKSGGGTIYVPDGYVKVEGEVNIEENGIYDIRPYARANVLVPNSGDGSSPVATSFNLTEMGLPDIRLDGTMVSCETDTTAIRTALAKGTIKIISTLGATGYTIPIECVMNNIYTPVDGVYRCSFIFDMSVNKSTLINFTVGDGFISAYLDDLSTTPSEDSVIPTFDLTEMGFPDITVDAEGVYEQDTTNTTEILSALDNGIMRIWFNLVYDNEVQRFTAKLTGTGGMSNYYCSASVLVADKVIQLLFVFNEDFIRVSAKTQPLDVKDYIDDYITNALGGDY